VLLNGRLKSLWVRANDLTDLLSVLEQKESRHGADSELLSDVWDFVDVELVEARVGVGVGEPVDQLASRYDHRRLFSCDGSMERALSEGGIYSLDDLRSDDLAGTAPGSEAVEDHQALLGVESFVELVLPGISSALDSHAVVIPCDFCCTRCRRLCAATIFTTCATSGIFSVSFLPLLPSTRTRLTG